MFEPWQYGVLATISLICLFVGWVIGASKLPPTNEEINSVYEENRRLVENNKTLVREITQLKNSLEILENYRAELKEWVVDELDNARPDSKLEAALETILEYVEIR